MYTSHKILMVLGLCAALCLIDSSPAFAQSTNRQTTRFGKSTYHHIDDGYSLKVEMKGEIEWEDDETDVKYISRGGYLEIEEKDRGMKHRLRIEGESGDRLVYAYRRNGKKSNFDGEASEWLEEIIPAVIRETGIGAESRTIRILKQQGVAGVFDEIDLIRSPSVKVKYLTYLFEHAKLTAEETKRAASLTEDVSSPGDKARFLTAAAPDFFRHSEALDAYFEAVQTISSPGDKTRTLIHLADKDLLASKPAYVAALETVRGISSPGDKSRFMIKAVPFFMPTATSAYFDVVNTISSPGDHARVLMSLLDETEFDSTMMLALLKSAKRISSPGDKARVLIAAIDRMVEMETNDEVVNAYLDAAESVSSPGDRTRVLINLIDNDSLSKASMIAVLHSAQGISSPGDKTRFLLRAADQLNGDDELVDAYLETAETVSSPGDRRRALSALLQ